MGKDTHFSCTSVALFSIPFHPVLVEVPPLSTLPFKRFCPGSNPPTNPIGISLVLGCESVVKGALARTGKARRDARGDAHHVDATCVHEV